MYRQDFKSLIIFISLWLFPTFSPKAEEILKTKETVEISSPEKPSNKENEPEEDPEKVKMNLEIRQMANEAYRALRFRNLKEATSLLKDIGRLNKKSVDYYYIEGAIYYSKNKFHQSILSLESAIKINPSHDRSQFLLGMNYIHLHIWKEAIPYFQQAVQSDPYDPFYRLNLSLANYFTQRFNDSALEAKKAVDLKNNYSDAKLLHLLSLWKLDKKSDFLKFYDAYSEKLNQSELAHIKLYYLARVKKDYKTAIKLYERNRGLSYDELRLLAEAELRYGNSRKAIEVYKKVFNEKVYDKRDVERYIYLLAYYKKEKELLKFLNSDDWSYHKNNRNFHKLRVHLEESRYLEKILYDPFK